MAEGKLSKQAIALAWATRNLSVQDWNNWCAKFVANAYGQDASGWNAVQGADALKVPARPVRMGPEAGWTEQQKRDILSKAKIGDLVFFDATQDNEYGHVGIYAGNGKMLAAEPNGVREVSVLGTAYNSARFRGTAAPPKEWQGRAADKDILAGAKNFQNVIEREAMPASTLTKFYQDQQTKAEQDITALNSQVAAAKLVKPGKEGTAEARAYADAQTLINVTAPAQLKDLDKRRDEYAEKYNKQLAEDNKPGNEKYTPTTEGGKRAEDLALEKAELDLEAARKKAEGAKTPEEKRAAELDIEAKETAIATAKANLARIGKPTPQTDAQRRRDELETQITESLVAAGIPLAQAQAALAAARANIPTEKEQQAQEDTAVNKAALSAIDLQKAQAEIAEIQAAQAAGEPAATRQARLALLQAQVQGTQAESERSVRINKEGGTLDEKDRLAIELSTLAVAEEADKKVARERANNIRERVVNGQITQAQGLMELGQFLDSMKLQLDERRQAEVERAAAEKEAQAREEHNKTLAEFASEQLSNMQGMAHAASRVGGIGSEANKSVATFNPGGDPNQTPAERVLAGLGLSMRDPSKPIIPVAKPAVVAPAPSVAAQGVASGTGVATQGATVNPTGIPAFDPYAEAQAGLNTRAAAGAPSGIGLPYPLAFGTA